MLHLLPHWNWAGREGKEMDVRCFSNCEEVELLLNGKSLGRKAMPRNSHLAWKVPYEPGTLRARGYNRFAQTNRYRLPWVGTLRTRSYNGSEKVAEAQVETTGAPAAIRLVPDRTEIRADGRDAAVFAVEVLDDRGRVVPTANNEIRFQVSANGRIIGVGNGNPSSHEPDRYWDRLNLNAVDVASWKTKSVPEIEDRPETAENFDDKDWREVRVDRQQPQRMAANACAVFRAGVDLTAAQLSCDEVKLCIGSIDDVGRVFVNGKLVGETRDRARNALFEVKDVLKPGRNVIAVAVRNNDGPGGLSAGVKVRMVRAERALWKRKAFNGYCQVIVQAGKEPGRITLKAESEGLRGAALTIDTK
jgi:beta-galactosidase